MGWRLEREQGWWRVVWLWAGGVAAGALGAGALQPHVHVVGASAAVYALLTAHLPNVCLRSVTERHHSAVCSPFAANLKSTALIDLVSCIWILSL